MKSQTTIKAFKERILRGNAGYVRGCFWRLRRMTNCSRLVPTLVQIMNDFFRSEGTNSWSGCYVFERGFFYLGN